MHLRKIIINEGKKWYLVCMCIHPKVFPELLPVLLFLFRRTTTKIARAAAIFLRPSILNVPTTIPKVGNFFLNAQER